jgi:hypothetical protein
MQMCCVGDKSSTRNTRSRYSSVMLNRCHHQGMAEIGEFIAEILEGAMRSIDEFLQRHREPLPIVAYDMGRDLRGIECKSIAEYYWRERNVIVSAVNIKIESKLMGKIHQRSNWVPAIGLDQSKQAAGFKHSEAFNDSLVQ